MTRNKKIGLLWLIGPTALLALTLSAFAISTFSATHLATNPASISSAQVALKAINVFLSLLGLVAVIGILIGIPIGISFLNKKDMAELDIASLQKLPIYAHLTPEQIYYIHSWSWGAFLGGTIWPLGNKLWLWTLLSLIPLVNLYSWIKLAMNGRQLSWEKGNWQNFDHFKKRQKLVAWVIGLAIPIGLVLQIIADIPK